MKITAIKTSFLRLEGAKKATIAAGTVGLIALAVVAFVAIQAACLHTCPTASLCFKAASFTAEGAFCISGLFFIYACLKPKKVSQPQTKTDARPHYPKGDWRET